MAPARFAFRCQPFTRQLQAWALAAAGLCSLSLAPTAQALSFSFRDVGATPMSALQLAAFQTAGDYWSRQLNDPVTVYIDIAFDNLGSGILGSASANFTSAPYSSVRSALAADVRNATDRSAVASLQVGPALSFMATQGDLSHRFDNDGSLNNTLLGLTTANAKALGLPVASGVNNPDASISFANAFSASFSYTREGGVPGNQIDFITVAQHEIGHALGFTSGVDDIDFCALNNFGVCGLPNSVERFESNWWYEPLDLFRYSSAGLDMRVGGSPFLSVDGGLTAVESFSTGRFNGNGSQAGHFGTGALNLMRPFVGYGQAYDATTSDLVAFDAIGWDLATPVPEPGRLGLIGAGLLLLFVARRRRQ